MTLSRQPGARSCSSCPAGPGCYRWGGYGNHFMIICAHCKGKLNQKQARKHFCDLLRSNVPLVQEPRLNVPLVQLSRQQPARQSKRVAALTHRQMLHHQSDEDGTDSVIPEGDDDSTTVVRL